MFIVGLTGGIGSGKSAIAQYFTQEGAPVVDVDHIAHQLLLPSQGAYALIIQHFGEVILSDDGYINKKKLKQLLFSDPKNVQWVAQNFHPLIMQAARDALGSYQAPYGILVIPLLIEGKLEHYVDRVLVVDVPEEIQVQRVMQRDSCSEADVKKIMSFQATRTERKQAAHDCIDNTVPLSEIAVLVHHLHQQYLEAAKG